ncbi:MAG: glycosyltransferase family 2 protein [Bradyrhizobium sp.]|uniref:glycosyltransferase family 2 protein n=1 Tax=Bradyrhizobium sp. TaxID=376 RepID=UPI001220FF71|nr:glycosyltransferase family 2 protein [Bradyrhizobium sp.]THD75418.1 MAG: glycosyltransferase family 2 protein [Bradyrhizobium sp.]
MSNLEKFKVAILLATKDGAEFLPEQLQSYRDQRHGNWELHVSDDGSSDSTTDIIDQFARDISQRVGRRRGPCQGFWRNFMSLARDRNITGDFFAFSDQDDIWSKEKLTRAVNWLAGIPETIPAVYCGRTEIVDRAGLTLGYSQLFTKAASFQNALVENIGGGNTMVFNRAAKKLLEACEPVEVIAHDWWTYQLVTATGGIVDYDPQPCLKYRQHGRNVSGSRTGLDALIHRFMTLFPNREFETNDIHIDALLSIKQLLRPESIASIELFAAARKGFLLERVRLLRQSGVYRQGTFENVAMFLGIIWAMFLRRELRLRGCPVEQVVWRVKPAGAWR